MKQRSIFALACVPLMAFSCASLSSLEVRPSSPPFAPVQTAEVLVREYTDALVQLDAWASANSYRREECNPIVATPLCKQFVANSLVVTVTLNAATNHVDVGILDWNGNQLLPVKRNLMSSLTAAGWIVTDKYAKPP